MNPDCNLTVSIINTNALKLSEEFTKRLLSIIIVISYAVAFYLLSLTLKQFSLDTTYAIMSAVGTDLISVILWKQQPNLLALISIAQSAAA
jgi:small multidrug resistance pump